MATAPREPLSPNAATPQAAATPRPRPAKVGVAFWWGWTSPLQVGAIGAAVREFEERNPGISVSTAQHSWGDKLMLAQAGGSMPDLFEWTPPAELAANGWLTPLDDLLSGSGAIGRSTFLDVSLKQGSWGGTLYGLPALDHFTHLTTVVNEDLFRQEGLEVPADVPVTFEEALLQSREHTTLDRAGNVDRLWYAFAYTLWPWLAAAHGIVAYDEDNQRFRFDDPAWIDVLTHARDWQEAFGTEKLGAWFRTHDYATNAPGCATCAGKLAVFDIGYWATGELARTAPDGVFSYSWHLVPSGRRGTRVQMIGNHYVMVPAATPRREQAWLLAEHLVSDESIRTLFDGCGFLLATRPLLEDPSSVIDATRYRGFDWHIGSIQQADELTGFVACPISSFVAGAWGSERNAVARGLKTVDQALCDLQRNCTQELERALQA
jgi:ABC-type glycerol-3-phosphate transport system substrate-binding protein